MKYFPLFLITVLMACDSKNESTIEKEAPLPLLIVQGHRGCRGLMPENSIPAFEKAIELGVSTLELDVVLSQEHQLMVSHEAWMNPKICFKPDGEAVATEEEGKTFNYYKMTKAEIQSFRFGTQGHPDFPSQRKISCQKPALNDVVKAARILSGKRNQPLPDFDIEIKSSESGDGVYHPKPSNYARIFLEEYFKLHLQGKATVQSFDQRLLRELHNMYPELPLVLLVEVGFKSLDQHISDLGFTPFGFSPHYAMVSDSLVESCKSNGIHLSTWTVNEAADIEKMLDLGIRDIISDYPNIVLEIARKKGIAIKH